MTATEVDHPSKRYGAKVAVDDVSFAARASPPPWTASRGCARPIAGGSASRAWTLDELTTGLDPVAMRDTWAIIKRIRDQGATIVLVTHIMAEAERLCDRVAILDAGRIAAIGTPAALGRPTLEDAFVALTSRRP